MSELCSNCQSSLHAWCCARCGSQTRVGKFRNNDSIYCSGKCERDQMREDRRSDAMERTIVVDRCVKCKIPTHASELDDRDLCAACAIVSGLPHSGPTS